MKIKNSSKRSPIKSILIFAIYEIFFMSLSAPLILLYGPFANFRKYVVATVMATGHRYLITSVLSKDQITKIVGVSSKSNDVEDTNMIKILHKNSNKLTLHTLDIGGNTGYLLEISDPTKVKVAMTNKVGITGEKTSQMAKEHNAVAAINGGKFTINSDYSGTGAYPEGFVMTGGKVVYPPKSDSAESVIAFAKGTLIVGNHTLSQLQQMGATEALCFRPPSLIINYHRQITNKLEDGYNPRTAIGQKSDGTILFLVVEGRKNLLHAGATLYDLQEIFMQYGAANAGVLDGGYSSTLYYDGKVVNDQSSWSGERRVATSIYVEP